MSPFVQAARQDAERTPLGQGPNRNWTSNARPGLAQGQGCPQRTLTDARDGEGQSPSARAVGQTGEPREPDAGGRTSGGLDLWCDYGKERVFPKSLAQPRSGGETPSRAAPSCPAWRSHAIQALGDIRQIMPLPTPHPNPLPQGERGWLPRPITLR